MSKVFGRVLLLRKELLGLEEMLEHFPITPSVVQGVQVPKLLLGASLTFLGRSGCCSWLPRGISPRILPWTSEDTAPTSRRAGGGARNVLRLDGWV